MTESIESLERRIDRLRGALRRAAASGDRPAARALRGELRLAEHAWEEALAELENQVAPSPPRTNAVLPPASGPRAALPPASGPRAALPPASGPRAACMLSIREQVHHALTLLTVPAAPKLIIAVHEAFFPGELVAARLTSLRRDEERSFRVAPFGRPYYLGPALTADLLAPARGLLAISTWPMERRVVGPLSPRVDFLTGAIQVATKVATLPAPDGPAQRLLWRFADSIPGARNTTTAIIDAARAELAVHTETDTADRAAAAERARARLDGTEQLFGSRLQRAPRPSPEERHGPTRRTA